MAINYKSGTETQSAITTDTNGNAIDLVGYSKLTVQTIFATCTGQAGNGDTAATQGLWIETSNDNSNWEKLLAIKYETNNSLYSGDTYLDIIPDHTAAISAPNQTAVGFGRYIRFIFAAANYTGGSVSYTVKWIARV